MTASGTDRPSAGFRVVAIDGPAGSGKSTVARALARRLGLEYLDTGAMYRSVAFAALHRGVDPEDREPVARLAHQITIEVADTVQVDGVDATIEIRGPEVTRAVSAVAANPAVRAVLCERQREWVRSHRGGVVEGRDMGTVVFPDAALKVYLTAADDERARRRHKEVAELHYDASSPGLAVESVQADLARRDHLDSTRTASPLAIAEDAVFVDTTGRTIDEIVDELLIRLKEAEASSTDADDPKPGRGAPAAEATGPAGNPRAAGDPAALADRAGGAPAGVEAVAGSSGAGGGSGKTIGPDRAVDRPVDRGVDRPVDRPVDRGVDRPVGRPVDHRQAPDAHGAWRPVPKGRLGTAFDMALYRTLRALILAFAKVFWRLRIEGAENLPTSGPYVVSPVHRSNLDSPLVGVITTRRLRFMGKDSLWTHRATARLFSALGGFPVHRGSVDRDALRRCMEVIEGGEPLVLFPEGTRQSGPLIQPLFEGAAYIATRTGVPIVPVGIGGSERAMPKGAKLLRPVRIVIVVGRPLEPPDTEGGDTGARTSRRVMKELTERLHGEIQALFDEAQAKAGA